MKANLALQRLGTAWKRFPLTLLTTVGLGVVSSVLFWHETKDVWNLSDVVVSVLVRLAMVLGLAVLLFTAVKLLRETEKLPHYGVYLVYAVVMIGLLVYGITLPDSSAFTTIDSARYSGAVVLAWLSILLIPLWSAKLRPAIWSYGVVLAAVYVIGVLFAGVLWAGMSAAVQATIFLFDLNRFPDLIGQLWIICATLVGPWIFLATLPQWHSTDWQNRLSATITFPNIVKWFVDYILVPLAILFIVILYIYLVMILVTWEWPKEGVTALIMGTTIYSLVVWLLAYPRLATSVWHRRAALGLFLIFLPLASVHLVAIGIRIQAYGFTPARYAVALYGIWLMVTAIYYLIQAKRPTALLYIPWSVIVLILVAVYSPVNAFSVARISQTQRLETMLNDQQLLVNNVITHPAVQLSSDVCSEIASSMDYLVKNVSVNQLPDWLQAAVSTARANNKPSASLYAISGDVKKEVLALHCKNYTSSAWSQRWQTITFKSRTSKDLFAETYQQAIVLEKAIYSQKTNTLLHDGDLMIQFVPPHSLSLGDNVVDLEPLIQNLLSIYKTNHETDTTVSELSTQDMTLRIDTDTLHGEVWLQTLKLNSVDLDAVRPEFEIGALTGLVLVQ